MDFSSCFRDRTMQVSSILQLIMIKLELASDDKVGLLDVIVLPFLIAVTAQTLLKSVSSFQGACFQALHYR